jgi:hypothetical protein
VSVTLDLTQEEIAQLKDITKEPSDAQAVALAAREFLRRSRLQELKQASGRVEFVNNWRQLEAVELNQPLPAD